MTRHTPSQREESPRHFFHMPLSGSPQISCIPVTSRQQPRGPHPSCAVAGGSLGCWGESRGGTREDWAAVGRSFLYLHEVCLERAGGQGLRWSVQVRFVFATSCSEPAHPCSPKAPLQEPSRDCIDVSYASFYISLPLRVPYPLPKCYIAVLYPLQVLF